jgi:N-acetylglucosaminyldiphosphoundecaprenol N-acetyl-beta-D-mannosaminyltransferase
MCAARGLSLTIDHGGSTKYLPLFVVERINTNAGFFSVWNASDSFVSKTLDRLDVPVEMIGGLPIAVIDRAQSAQLMIDLAMSRRSARQPALVFTSANGQVLSLCANDPATRALFERADVVHADGMPLVFASRWLAREPLPERVATTDLFHDVARRAERLGTTFYLLGATDAVIEQSVARARALYPQLRIVGYRGGYFGVDEEPEVIAAINAARPDILWVGMGVPREQVFAMRNRSRLSGVGIIKTSGGLFDFLSGKNRRAPDWMQALGLEWAFRTLLEPQRLAVRYLLTNPHAVFLLLTRTRQPGALALRGVKIDTR